MTKTMTDDNELLAEVRESRTRIETLLAELDEAYDRRADLFLRIAETAPGLQRKTVAEAAGVSGGAVSQQISKARTRRDGPS